MKKIFISFIIIATICSCCAFASDISKEDKIVDQFYQKSEETLGEWQSELNFLRENQDKHNEILKFLNKISEFAFGEIKHSLIRIIYIVLICILISVMKIYIKDGGLSEISSNVCFVMCSFLLITVFEYSSDTCKKALNDLFDYMSFAVPVYAGTLISGGFARTAASVQGLFMTLSTVIAAIIKNIVFPMLYCCGLLSIIGNISSTFNLSGFVSFISKAARYIIGLIMTIFAGILAFTGFGAVAGDNLALRTARYAIGNFVPVVGGCLSEALSSLLYSSAITKNAIGYIGFFTLLFICLAPIIKVFCVVFMLRLGSVITSMVGETSVTNAINSICDVLVSIAAMVILISVMFVLMITIVSVAG